MLRAVVLLAGLLVAAHCQTCSPNAPRTDCGYLGINQQQCVGKGCCWVPTAGEPWCFFKTSPTIQYTVHSIDTNKVGMKLTLMASGSTQFGDLISPLAVDITMETDERLHVKIYDSSNKRWEIPSSVTPGSSDPTVAPSNPLYSVSTAAVNEMFYFAVVRTSDGEVVFNSSCDAQPLQFVDQYLAVATTLPGTESLYGLGEHVTQQLQLTRGSTYTLWNFDTSTPPNLNLYGSHPFYMDLRQSGSCHGVYLRNSNGMDVVYNNGSLVYRVIGGVLDFYLFLGPSPEGVVQQYQEIIGRPHLPPYWGLGFHQSRYGYPNVQALIDVVGNYSANQVPLDTMWTDIDYMDEYRDFTLDPNNFPLKSMKAFVGQLHSNNMQYVVIIDPGIKVDKGYQPYDQGLAKDVFIKDRNGNAFTGKVWPGQTVFPDFFNPASEQYWQDQIASFYKDLIPVDGLWIDMNEISNFCNGECSFEPRPLTATAAGWLKFDPNNPPYKINNQGSRIPLDIKTLTMDSFHYGNVLEYNAHNLFGLMESEATSNALESVRGKRSFVISRSTFPGAGAYTGHWTGDNHANFADLAYSVPGMLNFQMFGIPLVGSDICGFNGDTSEELCSRWMELGAFYPFSRNHNAKGNRPQEPYQWPSVAAISRKVLGIRYSLLPYSYTLFYKAHRPVTDSNKAVPAATVTRPLFFEFPSDQKTHAIGHQFMVGRALMVSPVLDQGSTSVSAYFPAGRWYDFYSGVAVTEEGANTMKLDTPLDHIQVHIRGGTIIPQQAAAMTTAASRATNYTLLVALDDKNEASGDLYLDDGETIKPSQWSFLLLTASEGQLTATISANGDDVMKVPPLDTVKVLGLGKAPSQASYNGRPIPGLTYNSTTLTMLLTGVNADLSTDCKINWQ